MKFLKRGFTLAEVLLCVAIIGIVTALGMTATKQSVEKAFRDYYATAYINLYNILGDFEERDLFSNNSINSTNTFANQLANILSASVSDNTIVTAKNGITYNVLSIDAWKARSVISVTVPQAKTRQHPNGTDTFTLVYLRDPANGTYDLVPLNIAGQTNLQDRRDLLPTYLEDGLVGRAIDPDNRGRRRERQYRSFIDAHCDSFLGEYKGQINVNGQAVTILNCEGYQRHAIRAVLKVEKPSKAR